MQGVPNVVGASLKDLSAYPNEAEVNMCMHMCMALSAFPNGFPS